MQLSQILNLRLKYVFTDFAIDVLECVRVCLCVCTRAHIYMNRLTSQGLKVFFSNMTKLKYTI